MTAPSIPRASAPLDLRVGPPFTWLLCAGASHPGLVRDHNEDRLHLDPERGIFIVIDGMGGEAAGEKAAETALDFLRRRLERPTGTALERVREAITVANNEIFQLARRNPAWVGMGCVLTVALIENGRVTIGHVGDSRLYRIRAGKIEKVTHDHSPIGTREDEGELDEIEAMNHPRRFEVYRTVGQVEHTPLDREFVEIQEIPFDKETAVLLCSDGLSDHVTSDEISRVVYENAKDPAAVVTGLVEAANAAGGKDNVTVLFVMGERFGAPERRGARRGVRSSPPLFGKLAGPPLLFSLGVLAGMLAFVLLSLIDTRFLGPRRSVLPIAQQPVSAGRLWSVGPGAPFATIGDALRHARAADTVRVAPGIYRERVRLVEGVLLMAESPRQSQIVPPDGATPVVALVAEGLRSGRVIGFDIESGSGSPLDFGIVIRNADIAIEDIQVSGARVAGVAIEGSSRAALRSSLIRNNLGAGIAVRAPATPRIAYNRVIGNGRATSGPGVDLGAGARPTLTGNLVVGNAAEGIRGVASQDRASILSENQFLAAGSRNGAGAITVAGGSAGGTEKPSPARGKR